MSTERDAQTLAFAEDLVTEVLDGRKTATVRKPPKDIRVGDTVVATTPDGSHFATLRVTRTATVIAAEVMALIETFGAEYGCETTEELLEALENHYGEALRPGRVVQLIVFEVLD